MHSINACSSSPKSTNNCRKHMESAGSSHYSSNSHQQILCYCGSKAPLRRSQTRNNPGRLFYGCKNYRSNMHCDFFEWYDPPTFERGNELNIVERMMEMQSREDDLERREIDLHRKNEELIAREKWKFFIIVVLVLCFAMWLNGQRTNGCKQCYELVLK